MSFSRRRFLAASAAALSLPMVADSRVLAANDEIRVGLVGLGGRGVGAHLPGFQSQPGVSVVAICDPDQDRLGSTAEMIKVKYGHDVEQYTDVRRLLERPDIDCVANATQNYWHGLSTIWACEAGKHVYCEKPLSHYIWEGRQMVNAARRHNRIVQCGTQRRSQTSIRDGIAWIQAGNLGKIERVYAFANKGRSSCGKRATPLELPASLDYELWCGPARKEPIYRDRLQYDCSFLWNTGDGESCNQGVHEMDIARWCLGETWPRRVMSLGGRFVFDDACDVPNTQIIYYDFAAAPVLYEVHNLRKAKDDTAMPDFRGEGVGVIVECEGGSVSLYRGLAMDRDGKEVARFSGNEDHFVNFVQAVRSGRREDLNAEIEVGHLSTAVCHAGNISLRVGQAAPLEQQRAQVREIPELEQMYDRFAAHLAAHEVDLNTVTLGPWLELDAEHECFRDHGRANEIVRGYYREPFQVKEIV